MNDAFRESDWAGTLSGILRADLNTCEEAVKIIKKVAFLCLKRHVGAVAYDDMHIILSMVHDKLSKDGRDLFEALESGKCTVHAWLAVITRQTAMTHIRRRHYPVSSVSEIFRAMNVDVRGAEDYLDALTDMFTPTHKYVLRLRHGEGCDISQTAAILGVSPREVKAVEHQAMERLRKEWTTLKSMAPLQ